MNKIILFFIIICNASNGFSQSTQTMSDNYTPIPQVVARITKHTKPAREISRSNDRECKMEIDNCPILTYPDSVYLDGPEADADLIGRLITPAMPPNPDNCEIKTTYKNNPLGYPQLTYPKRGKGSQTIVKYADSVLTYLSLRSFFSLFKYNVPVPFIDTNKGTMEIKQKIDSKCGELKKDIVVICRSKPTITKQISPDFKAGCLNEKITLSIEATVPPNAGTISYQWQKKSGNGSWPNIGPLSPSPNLEITVGQGATRYRCIIMGRCAAVTSSESVITSNNCTQSISD